MNKSTEQKTLPTQKEALRLWSTRLHLLGAKIDPCNKLSPEQWRLVDIGFFIGLGFDLKTASKLAGECEV